jgi:hypothetical protein
MWIESKVENIIKRTFTKIPIKSLMEDRYNE